MGCKKIYIVLLSVIVISVLGYLYKWHLVVWYEDLTKDHFALGDKVYASPSLFVDEETNAVILYKIIRPLTEAEIDDLVIDNNEKISLKEQSNKNKPYVVNVNKYFTETDMNRAHSAYIGTFKSREVLNVQAGDKLVFTNFYAIEPNKNIYTDLHNDDTLPKGYTWKDNALYVMLYDVTDHEAEKFKQAKK